MILYVNLGKVVPNFFLISTSASVFHSIPLSECIYQSINTYVDVNMYLYFVVFYLLVMFPKKGS